jgi:hypothetical protein
MHDAFVVIITIVTIVAYLAVPATIVGFVGKCVWSLTGRPWLTRKKLKHILIAITVGGLRPAA